MSKTFEDHYIQLVHDFSEQKRKLFNIIHATFWLTISSCNGQMQADGEYTPTYGTIKQCYGSQKI